MVQLAYAGIGPRRVPADILDAIAQLATHMTAEGWHLHTGASEGGCDAFATSVPAEERTRYLPWPGYRGLSGPDCVTLTSSELRECSHVAADFHPGWKRAKPDTRKRLAHDVAVLLGADARTPVHAIVLWTPLGRPTPDTEPAERLARAWGIPFLNLADRDSAEIGGDLEWIACNIHSGG